METMNINDLVFVAFLEISINALIALCLCFDIKEYIEKNFIKFNIKMLFMMVFVSVCIFLERKYLTNIIAISTLSIIAFILAFKLIWKLNYRFSIVSGIISIFFIMSIEFITYPLFPIFLDFLNSNSFWQNRFVLTLPSRLIQLLVLFIIIKKEYSFKHITILGDDWKEMDISSRVTATLLLVSISICMIFIFNFQDLFMKLNANKNKDLGINLNLAIYFIQCFIYIATTMLLIGRTKKYSTYKEILTQEPIEIFEQMLEIASEEEMEAYANKIKQYSIKKPMEVKEDVG